MDITRWEFLKARGEEMVKGVVRFIIIVAIFTFFYFFTSDESAFRFIKYVALMAFTIIALNYFSNKSKDEDTNNEGADE